MLVTREMAAEKLNAYLHHTVSLPALVTWAEDVMMEGEFDVPATRDTVARLGLADVRAFGLSWEDCERMFEQLGYSIHIEVAAA